MMIIVHIIFITIVVEYMGAFIITITKDFFFGIRLAFWCISPPVRGGRLDLFLSFSLSFSFVQ